MSSWQQWNERLVPIWAEVFSGHLYLDDGPQGEPLLHLPHGVTLVLSPSHWGMGNPADDRGALEGALEQVVQGHAPDYWRDTAAPLVQALGWLDKRIGRRSIERWKQSVGHPRNSLEKTLMDARERAETEDFVRRHRATATAPTTIRVTP